MMEAPQPPPALADLPTPSESASRQPRAFTEAIRAANCQSLSPTLAVRSSSSYAASKSCHRLLKTSASAFVVRWGIGSRRLVHLDAVIEREVILSDPLLTRSAPPPESDCGTLFHPLN